MNGKKDRIRLVLSEKKIREALDIVEKDVDSLFEIGLAAWGNENHDMAEKIFSQVLVYDPDNAGAWFNRGIALGNLRKYEEAVACYDEAIERNCCTAQAWYNKGIALQELETPAEALACFDRAIEIEPSVKASLSKHVTGKK